MRFFSLVDFQYWALALFLGLTALVFVFVAWGTYPRRPHTGGGPDIEKASDLDDSIVHDGGGHPMPPFLILVYAVIIMWAVGYMIFMGIRGTNI